MKKKFWLTKDIFGACTVWDRKPKGPDIFIGDPDSIVKDKSLVKEYLTDAPFGFIKSISIKLLNLPDKFWISCDYDGHMDIWSIEPEWGSVWLSTVLAGGFGNIDYMCRSQKVRDKELFKYLKKQIGLPARDTCWEVTIKDGTFFED